MSSNSEVMQNVGIVKWFNNKQGYGFLTVMSTERKGEDLFVHHSTLTTKDNQYKYLVQGEYVNFDFSKVTEPKENREWQAVNVTGCCGGNLMCETRNENKAMNQKHFEGSKGKNIPSRDKTPVGFEED
jgi:cold shock CspA family protein|tara:strand:- start:441 stop:824 length:384 start_codon:yes stop_codon:yes gene_type:complete